MLLFNLEKVFHLEGHEEHEEYEEHEEKTADYGRLCVSKPSPFGVCEFFDNTLKLFVTSVFSATAPALPSCIRASRSWFNCQIRFNAGLILFSAVNRASLLFAFDILYQAFALLQLPFGQFVFLSVEWIDRRFKFKANGCPR